MNFTRQALPLGDYETNVAPVGIDTENGGEVTFSAYVIPIENRKFILEDRLTSTFTDLETSSYTVTIPAQTYGTGRFYVHSVDATGIEEPVPANYNQLNVRVWTSGHLVNIEGELSGQATGTLYDLLGRTLLETRLGSDKLSVINVPSSAKGVYLLRIMDGQKMATRKVVF